MSKISLDKDIERNLIRKVQKGDKESFTLIFQHYHPYIKAYFRARKIENQNCEDLSSVVFEKALKGIDNFRWQGLSLSSWLYKIARNVLIDYFRDSEKTKLTTYSIEVVDNLPSAMDTPEEKALKDDTSFLLSRILSELPEREARIVYLKFFEGYTNKGISEILKLSETNVSTIVYRTVNKFRDYLSNRSTYYPGSNRV